MRAHVSMLKKVGSISLAIARYFMLYMAGTDTPTGTVPVGTATGLYDTLL